MARSEQNCNTGNSQELFPIRGKKSGNACGCQSGNNETTPPPTKRHFITGSVLAATKEIPQISTQLEWKDYLGASKVRWGINRNHYRVDPGIYAVGTPNERSDVFVTANYKLTFDLVRKNLDGMNAWLLVLDTKGVNVWCAAGKGTFGTKELVKRIQLTSLEKIVLHRRMILPQLGATGIAAHLVKEASGFTVIYGPVRATDIQSFVQAGYKATKEMRRVNFDWYDRLKLVPNDLGYNLRYFAIAFFIFFMLAGINTDGFSLRQAISKFLSITQIIAAGYVAGIVLTPLLLPYIPFRSFSYKGFIVGAIVSVPFLLTGAFGNTLIANISGVFLASGFSSFLAMNFTGASTFTSLAGVKKEMKVAVPMQIATGTIAAILAILNNFIP
jgi:hypothetical protein